ncbi:PAS domain-containing protein [Cellulophaga sp. HaHaR_3_176]|uniref:PAS domain-containing sensor histidine kinase n=1 Tax=Cellulophaga sp. HaHaR_3_176 TaxID=1942464 RepID=UPI001C1F9377|nr:PAS domain-containing sensor histidine kinase [Cellulophaga sp. HaHaR_3_176]QWX82703.1 PAS domain-containing protein [Cellulophaga sp. HaHaR_3_176]
MDRNIATVENDLKGAFFDMAHSPFVILNKDLVFIDTNQAAISTLNVKREDFIGKSMLELFPYLSGTEKYSAYQKVIETGEPIGLDEVFIHTDKGIFKFIIRAFKIGEGLGITTLDVTNLMNSIEQLKSTQTNLEKVNKNLKQKNQELEEFSYVAAHDLRAPLTNLHSLLDMLEAQNAISEIGKPIFKKVQYVGNQMCDKLKALNNVIALKSSLGKRKEEISFSAIINKIKVTHSEEILNSRTIIKEDFSSCPTILYDPIQFESILHNLISNSIKYKHPKRKPVIYIKTKIVNGKKTLTIKDNGIGFDEDINPNKIFGLFKRMHTHVDGLGVGLYIIHSIINNNGGGIKVNSKINKGTEFKINF